MTYKEANAKLPMGRNFLTRKIANHTYLKRREKGIAVELWGHDIMLFYPDERVRLDASGYETYITKERMNKFSTGKFHLYAKDGQWLTHITPPDYADLSHYWQDRWCPKTGCRYRAYVPANEEYPARCLRCGFEYSKYTYYHYTEKLYPFKTIPFQSGMIIHPDGQVTGAPPAIQYKQKYDNRNDLFFGVFAANR